LTLAVEDQMYERLGVTRPDNTSKRDDSFYEILVLGGAAPRDLDGAFLTSPLYAVKNHVFLEHIVVTKGVVPRFENVNPLQVYAAQQMPAKRSKIRPVAEASRCNGDELSFIVQEHDDESEKSCVEVARFYADTVEKLTRAGLSSKLLVWRIQDRQIKGKRLRGKEARVEGANSRLDEVLCSDLPFAGHANLDTRSLAGL
jgi:hypothetical protein